MKTYLLSVGREDVAVAAPSKKRCVEILNEHHFGWSMYSFNRYYSNLRDDHPIAVMALAKPEVVFKREHKFDAPWEEVA